MIRWFNNNFMRASPSKFQLILFGTSLQTGSINVNGDITTKSRTTVKLIGTYLDSKLCFKEHVSNLCSKANKRVNALARVSRTLDTASKLSMVRAFILCYFNYCPLVCHFCGSECSKIWNVCSFEH